uniref:OCRE domain-containing protein n=1 Tax=Schistosoma mansoni TaxID=6183 RepID=A0A5K4EI65_SCHMA
MEFDVFEKLSELETEIHILKKELEEKDAFIQNLMDKNTDLERRLLSLDQNSLTGENNLPRLKEVAPNGSNTTDSKTYGASIANMLKETSEAVVRNTGYTFDERTGLYYDHKSGYYYDPENQLFYEPKTGTYYKYNSETGEYTNYTASEDDAMNSKFKEFAHPVYAHLLKVSLYRVIGSSVEIQLYRKQSNPLERNKHLTFYLDFFTYILFYFHCFSLSGCNCWGT